MVPVNNIFFLDKDGDSNTEHGISVPYAGIVTERARNIPTASGKDYLVEYIDAWGVVITSWRAVHEVTLSIVNDDDWNRLQLAINTAAKE